eukprot:scaffold18666_cov116-Isochrysis_galbana.AAC.1
MEGEREGGGAAWAGSFIPAIQKAIRAEHRRSTSFSANLATAPPLGNHAVLVGAHRHGAGAPAGPAPHQPCQ